MERTIRALTRHYPRRDEAVVQVVAVLDRFRGLLNPEQSDFTYDDGRVELLLSLTGVLPIPIQANTYHCPIVFWLPLDFPSTPPIVFILPSETLAVRKGKNVDAGGRVTVQYLEQWARKSEGCSLASLIDELIPIFSARYPVTTVQPKAPARPPPPPVPSTSIVSADPTVQHGSPAQTFRPESTTTSPPPRPPLPGQGVNGSRPSSVVMDGTRRPTSIGEASGILPNGAPPRPPLPPGVMHDSQTLPPGPPPLYRPSSTSQPFPPFSAPQRSSTIAYGASASTSPIPPFLAQPPAPPASSQAAVPPQPPVPHAPSHAGLGRPASTVGPPPLNDPSQSQGVPSPAVLPLPGTFSPAPPGPPPPPREAEYRRDAHSQLDAPQSRVEPPRPYSPSTSTVRSYSPAPPAPPPQPPMLHGYASPPRQARVQNDPHRRQDSYDSLRSAQPINSVRAGREAIHPSRPYSTARSEATSPPQSPQAPPSRESNRTRPFPPPASSAASVASASEYEAEYGSYMPPAISSAVSLADDDATSSVANGMRSMTIHDGVHVSEVRRDSYDPYRSTGSQYEDRASSVSASQHEPIDAFEPVIESRVRQQQQQHRSRGSFGSDYTTSSGTVPYYPQRPSQSVQPPQPPAPPSSTPYAPRPPQQAVAPTVGAPRPGPGFGGYAPSSSASSASYVNGRPIRNRPSKPTVNILDAADEDLDAPSSVVPTSPSSFASPTRPGSSTLTTGPAPSNVAPPVPPNPAVLALRTRLHSKLSSALAALHSEVTANHLEPLALMHSDLLKAVPAIEDEMARLRAVRDVCLNVRDRYRAVVEQGEARMAEYERRGEGVDVDEIVCGSTVVYTQLLDLVAEDAALEDTIYALGRGLNSGTANIDLDQFLKRVRVLAREQFLKRATINKILLGLAIRRERSQQQQRERNGTGSGSGGRGTPAGGGGE
ncbi:hypothetical protein JCM10212_006013 [Sporobolomyces blumeae]